MIYLIAIITILIFLAASYGWGYATMRLVARNESYHFSFLSAVGIACWIFLGGILNLAGIAYPAAMYALLLSGLIFFLMAFSAMVKPPPILLHRPLMPGSFMGGARLAEVILPPGMVITAIIFSAITLIPAGAFNFADDFHTYIARPLRMLQTGSLAGNPFDLLGLDSLGAQAFLQGFFLLALPIEYLSSFDAVFGFGLAGLLLVAMARKFNLNWVYATLPVLVFIVINPQSVNVSALYSGIFIILGLLLTSCLLTERLNEPSAEKPLRMAALLGLFFSSLVALKTTLAIFAALYSIVFFGGLLVIAQQKRRALLVCGMSALAATATILPWLALHWRNYAAAIQAALQPAITANAGEFSLPKGHIGALFSKEDLFWGGSLLDYWAIVSVLALLGAFSIFFALRNGENYARQRGYSLVAAAACGAAIANFFVNGFFFDPPTAVRYACPVLVAALPFALLMATGQDAATLSAPLPKSLTTIGLKLAVLAGAGSVIFLFWDSFMVRIERAYRQHTTLSFPISDGAIRYNRYVFSPETRQSIRNIQYQTEANKKILAWISMPLHLDFSRNEIISITGPGLANPWVEMPLNGNAVDMARYLKQQGIRYIMWEYQGAGMTSENTYRKMLAMPFPLYRKIGARNLYLMEMLNLLMGGGTFLYLQNGIVLFDLDQIN